MAGEQPDRACSIDSEYVGQGCAILGLNQIQVSKPIGRQLLDAVQVGFECRNGTLKQDLATRARTRPGERCDDSGSVNPADPTAFAHVDVALSVYCEPAWRSQLGVDGESSVAFVASLSGTGERCEGPAKTIKLPDALRIDEINVPIPIDSQGFGMRKTGV